MNTSYKVFLRIAVLLAVGLAGAYFKNSSTSSDLPLSSLLEILEEGVPDKLPMKVDNITMWDSLDVLDNGIVYNYTVDASPEQLDAGLDMLKVETAPKACAVKTISNIIQKNGIVTYSYTTSGEVKHTREFTLKNGDCE